MVLSRLHSTLLVAQICAYACLALETVDVAIVGGGLSGLSAAKDLVKASKSVKVLEARDRVGGRVLNLNLPNGGIVEGGAEYIGPTQDRVIALAEELDLKLYDAYLTGNSSLYVNGTVTLYDASTSPIPLELDALYEIATIAATLNEMASGIDVKQPWSHPNAQEWDSMTLATWLSSYATHSDSRLFMDVAIPGIFSAETRELSLLYTVAYIAAGGNETVKGTLEGLEFAAQQWRVEGGTQLLATKLAEKLGSTVVTPNSAVRKIQKQSDGYLVASDGESVVAKHVIVAMSPPLAARIDYDPILPPGRDQLTQRMPMGSIGKIMAIYSEPWWRADGHSGQAFTDTGVSRVISDISPNDASFGGIMGFIEADEMRKLDTQSEDEIKKQWIEELVAIFGSKAADVTTMVMQRWDLEKYSRGGPVAYGPPGVLTEYGPYLSQAFGNIHFAGTESSDYWPGYMDGAIRSGERAAQEVLANF